MRLKIFSGDPATVEYLVNEWLESIEEDDYVLEDIQVQAPLANGPILITIFYNLESEELF